MKKLSLEFPASSTDVQQAVDDAADGRIVLLNRGGQVIAAIVPFEVAAAGMAALDAADDAVDLYLARQIMADLRAGMETIRLADLRRELAS